MSSKATNLLFGQSLLSTAHGFWVTSALFTAIPLLYDLNVFSDVNEQPDDPGIYAVIELCLAGTSFLIALAGSFGVLASKFRLASSTSQFILGSFYTMAFLGSAALLYLRLNMLGWLYDWGIGDGVGTCSDSSFTGNPTYRLTNLTSNTIESISDCKFNVYDINNVNTFSLGAGSPTLVDWSNKFNYDASNAAVLASYAQSAGADVDAAGMPLIHNFWYWGCNEICHPRYKLNRTWLFYTMASTGIYLILMGLSFGAATIIKKDEELGEDKKDEEMQELLESGQTDSSNGDSFDEEDNNASFSSMKF